MRCARQLWVFVCFLLMMSLGVGCEEPSVSRAGKLATDAPQGRLTFASNDASGELEKQLLLFNESGSVVTIDGISIANDPEGRFSMVGQPTFPLRLEAGQKAGITLTVRLSLGALKGFTAQLVIQTPDAENRDESDRFLVPLEFVNAAPKLVMSCTAGLDFGEVKHGQSRSQLCQVTNAGSGTLRIQQVDFVPDPLSGDVAEFRWKAQDLPVDIAPGEANGVTLQFDYKPTDVTVLDDAGTFVLTTNESPGATPKKHQIQAKGRTLAALIRLQTSVMSCTGNEACASLDPALQCAKIHPLLDPFCHYPDDRQVLPLSLLFGAKPGGALMIRSVGNLPLEVLGVSFVEGATASFYLADINDKYPKKILPGEYTWVDFRWDFKAFKKEQVNIEIKSNAVNAPRAPFKVTADFETCQLYAYAPHWRDGKISLGSLYPNGDTQVIKIYDYGGTPCKVNKVTLVPVAPKDASAFKMELSRPVPSEIKAMDRGSFQLKLTFAPEDTSQKYEAEIHIESDDPRRPLIKLPLQGATSWYQSCLKVTSPDFDFPRKSDGTCRPPYMNVVIQHTGGPRCPAISVTKVAWADWSSKNFTVSAALKLPLVVAPNQSVNIPVAFRDRGKTDPEYAHLYITTDNPHQPTLIAYASTTYGGPFFRPETKIWEVKAKGQTYVLPGKTVAEAVSVEVDGKALPRDDSGEKGWRYDLVTNAVILAASATPKDGTPLLFNYQHYCDWKTP